MSSMKNVVDVLVDCLRSGNKVLTFGVGGNATTAMHFAGELSGKYEQFEDPLPCVCLCDNIASITAITNDFGWREVFRRQIAALAREEDVLVVFSISTTGVYLLPAISEALKRGCKVVLICGQDNGNLVALSSLTDRPELLLLHKLDSLDTPRVQEQQLRLVHDLCLEVKSRLAKEEVKSEHR